MSNKKLWGICGATILALALAAQTAKADPLRYGYVPLDQVTVPAPYVGFSPSVVVGGRVYGTVFDATGTIFNVAVYSGGTVTVGPAGATTVANASGEIGGVDSTGLNAALFQGGTTTVVPTLPNQDFANIVSLGDNGLALLESTDTSFNETFAYVNAGNVSVINFGLSDPAVQAFMNNAGLIGLNKQTSRADRFDHGYLYNPSTQTSTFLPPSPDPTDVNVLIQGINAGGDVLGYSFTDFFSSDYHERVGVWQNGIFKTYFFETLNTSLLVFNDRDEIVISNSEDGNGYLVPTPGTRLDLASLTSNLPAGLQLSLCFSIDNAGNITGFAVDQNFNFFPFLLETLGPNDPPPGQVKVKNPVPASIVHRNPKSHKNK